MYEISAVSRKNPWKKRKGRVRANIHRTTFVPSSFSSSVELAGTLQNSILCLGGGWENPRGENSKKGTFLYSTPTHTSLSFPLFFRSSNFLLPADPRRTTESPRQKSEEQHYLSLPHPLTTATFSLCNLIHRLQLPASLSSLLRPGLPVQPRPSVVFSGPFDRRKTLPPPAHGRTLQAVVVG